MGWLVRERGNLKRALVFIKKQGLYMCTLIILYISLSLLKIMLTEIYKVYLPIMENIQSITNMNKWFL